MYLHTIPASKTRPMRNCRVSTSSVQEHEAHIPLRLVMPAAGRAEGPPQPKKSWTRPAVEAAYRNSGTKVLSEATIVLSQ